MTDRTAMLEENAPWALREPEVVLSAKTCVARLDGLFGHQPAPAGSVLCSLPSTEKEWREQGFTFSPQEKANA